jgi:hypothetical protein
MFSSNTSAVSGDAVFVEDVFSTWLYTGNSSTQTITNGIDLAGKGGLVWTKSRQDSGLYHVLSDSATGPNNILRTNSTAAAFTYTSVGWSVPVFNTNGYTTSDSGYVNQSVAGFNQFVSWTFRKQPKFFDVVTYTGNGSTQAINHSLGSTPGCIIVKNITSATVWSVWHRSVNSGAAYGVLNLTDAFYTDSGGTAVVWGNNTAYVAPTSTQFTVGSNSRVNTNGDQYVAYLFAHDAGGFGLTGTDNVITCGSYTGNGSATGPTITLGYEPQWLLVKRAVGGTSSWNLYDTMRGMPVSGATFALQANLSGTEYTGPNQFVAPSATGFYITSASSDVNTNGDTYIYIAIRRGPMKTPTTGTSVFSPLANNNSTGTKNTTNFPVDMQINTIKQGDNRYVVDRLRGVSTNSTAQPYELRTNDGAAENATNNRSLFWDNTGFQTVQYYGSATFYTAVYYNFRRAPGFFDVVCYTGNGTAGTAISHNLGVVPELVITKKRSAAASWYSLYQPSMRVIFLNSSNGYLEASLTKFYFGNNSADVSPTASTFTVASDADINQSGATYVAYLFASVAGVSKVGSYTGTGALQTINCGFTGGARFVLIKRTDSAGSWYVYDSARGISSGNDPYLLLNGTAAEVTNTNYVDTTSVGFQVTAAAPAGLNANGGTYIFLAIA